MIAHPWVLILDGEEGQLGGVALQLVRFGVDAVYVKHFDEAALQTIEYADQIGAILLHSGFALGDIDRAVDEVGRRAGLGPSSFALLGPKPDGNCCEDLAKKGFRWRLWSPFDEGGLRFIARAPLWIDNDADLRMDLRVPTQLSVDAESNGEKRRALISDLSTGGAYVETTTPFAAGDRVSMAVSLAEGPIELVADVRWVNASKGGSARAARPVGMGVEFAVDDRKTLQELRQYLDKNLERYRL